jgi:hypothetical protein
MGHLSAARNSTSSVSAGTFGSGLLACQAALVSCKHPGFNSRNNAECKQAERPIFGLAPVLLGL